MNDVKPWRIAVDATRCIGSGICAGTAPRHFAVHGSVSVPLRDDPDESVLDAAESCPVEAIEVRDASGQVIAPAL